MTKLPLLVVDFDGILDTSLTDRGWFDLGVYHQSPAKKAIQFLIEATEFYTIAIFGPRSLMFGGIQTIQAALIFWVRMEVNEATMHDLMDSRTGLQFPTAMPEQYAMAINNTHIDFGTEQDSLTPDGRDFIDHWYTVLTQKKGIRLHEN